MMSLVLDHLWQSTLLALLAGLMVLSLRKAAAGVRYGLWFAGSIKFLIPFAALAALGRHLAPALRLPVAAGPETRFIATAAEPFSRASLSRFPFAHAAALQAPAAPPLTIQPLPAAPVHAALHLDLAPMLAVVWAAGCAAVLVGWAARWARVSRVVRSARPLAWPAPMPVLASPSLMEPGLVGLFRPVLVLPETLPERLTRAEIDAILAHEISHLRRRDNLTAAIHMLVEALFWFHPLVWWIGGRMIAEREQACDEAVVHAGHDRAAYARGLLESSRLYLQSPLSCVAGASGSELKTRVLAIMTAPPSSPLAPPKKALLLAAGAAALVAPVGAGLLTIPEARQAVVRVTAVASNALGAAARRAREAAAEPAPAEQRVARTRNEALLPPPRTLAKLDAIPVRLSQELPGAVQAWLSRLQPPALEAEPLPAPRTARSAPALSATRAAFAGAAHAVVEKQAFDFVRTYALSSPDLSDPIARWGDPLCVQVVGLVPEQAELIKARVTEVAKAVGAKVAPPDCRTGNVEIAFTADPKRLLDHEAGRRGWDVVGAARNGGLVGHGGRAGHQPIQAWYSAVVADQSGVQPGQLGNKVFDDCNSRLACPLRDVFQVILVVVDLGGVRGASPAAVADYVAMAALSQPRALDHCNTLPSVTDLFAGACPARDVPTGLTAADAAYLAALYEVNPETTLTRQRWDIAGRMAEMLSETRVASR